MTAPHFGTLYPVMLDLRGRRVVVIGGGTIAEGKIRGLVEAGARVRIVSPALTPALEALALAGAVEVERRHYHWGDLAGATLAVGATDDRSVNASIWAEAEERGVLLNAVDDVAYCHFIAPSVHREGDITIAVSSAGTCPALAVRLRERIATIVRQEHAALARLAWSVRTEIARRVPNFATRTKLWYRIVDSPVLSQLRQRDDEGARQTVERLVRETEGSRELVLDVRRGGGAAGEVYLVGAGPGDAGLITARGLELLRRADVVVYDRLVGREILAEARADARLIPVGKHGHGPSAKQEDINELLVEEANRGALVVRLKGGDPYVFGRGAEEGEALRAAGVRFKVVPGVSSAVSVPALAGIPVTHRSIASGFAVVTGHECIGNGEETTLDWDALARMPTLVVLMGLKGLERVTARLRAAGARADLPAAVISRGSTPDERVVTGTLATIARLADAAALEQPATLVVGEVVRVREKLVRSRVAWDVAAD